MKRILLLVPLILLFAVISPAAAQDVSPLDWIPADFAGFVRVDTSDPRAAVSQLGLALFVSAVLQPSRAPSSQVQGFDTFFPLDTFDMENASFTTSVLPWVKNEVVIAYRSLSAGFQADAENTLLILPTGDAFQAASFLNQIIQAQDLLQRETYRDVSIYDGDKTAFAFAPAAILIGPADLLHEAIDTLSGNSAALTADPVYQQVQAALPDTSLLSAYVANETAAHALSVLVSGSAAADPFFSALNDALVGDQNSPERLLLNGSLDGIGVSVDYDQESTQAVHAQVALHTTTAPAELETPFDNTVLNLIPRSAMIVQSGADAGSTAADALYVLPLLNFAGTALAAFPVSESAGAQVLPTPTGQDIQSAVDSFLTVVKPIVDVQSDLLPHLNGSYSLALLPRPNDPMPGLNIPFDLLLVVQTDSADDAQAAQASASKLLATFTTPLESEQLSTQNFDTLRDQATGEPLVRIGTVDNLLVIGTGSAAQLALDAERGDNRLIAQARWQALSADDQIPYVYVDVGAFYNTFLPQVGADAVRPVSQLGIHSSYLGDNLFKLDLMVVLTQ